MYKFKVGDEVMWNGSPGIIISRNLFELNTPTIVEKWYNVEMEYVTSHVREEVLSFPMRGCFTLGDEVVQVSGRR